MQRLLPVLALLTAIGPLSIAAPGPYPHPDCGASIWSTRWDWM